MESSHIDIQNYLRILTRSKILFIVASLCIMSVIVWGGYFLPKKYSAASTVFIERNVINELVKGIAITPSMGDRIRVLRYAMLSRHNVSNVLKSLNLDAKLKNDGQLEDLITSFQARTNIQIKGDDLFIVSINDPDPKVSRDYINALVGSYVEENVSSKRNEAFGATRFISEQLTTLKDKLVKSEDAVIKYRQQQGIYLATDDKSLISDIKKFREELENTRSKKNELTATKDSVKKQLEGEQPLTVSSLTKRPSSSSNNIVALENRLKQLLIQYTDHYPEVIKLKATIEAIKQGDNNSPEKGLSDDPNESETSSVNPIHQSLKQQLMQIESEQRALDAKQKQLMVKIGERERDLRYFPEGQRKLGELEKERENNRQLFEQLSMRQGQSEISKQMEISDKTTTFRVVDPAVIPTKPASPNRPLVFIGGIFFGILGGLVIVILREQLDTSVKNTMSLKDLGVRMLIVIPEIFNEGDNMKTQKKERFVYAFAGGYFLFICFTLVLELLGISYVDFIVSKLKPHGLTAGLTSSINWFFS